MPTRDPKNWSKDEVQKFFKEVMERDCTDEDMNIMLRLMEKQIEEAKEVMRKLRERNKLQFN